MVIVSSSAKLHAFALAEQMQKASMLSKMYTSYFSEKNTFLKFISGRKDTEDISAGMIRTFPAIALLKKVNPYYFLWDEYFDKWVARQLTKESHYSILVGWSGMSLNSFRVAADAGKTCILERGSAHIEVQYEILNTEYKKFGKKATIDKRVVEKEIKEYELADFISIPSDFVKETFIQKGVDARKLVVNPYGVANSFIAKAEKEQKNKKVVLYLGTISIQKGVHYLMQALSEIAYSQCGFEVWFVGNVKKEMFPFINKYRQSNWKILGHVPHHRLVSLLEKADIGVAPSLQDGFAMVVPQMMACGLPVICSENTGAKMMIREAENGFVIPTANHEILRNKIELLLNDKVKLSQMQYCARQTAQDGFTWDDYGRRYISFISSLC